MSTPIERAFAALAEIPKGASFNRGKSKQDYSTPEDFRLAVAKRFGHPAFDLAASFGNQFALGGNFFSEEQDSLKQQWWQLLGPLWLNPPFNDIAPWAEKCAYESARACRILFLVPASVGSNWFAEHVHNRAFVHFLNPRLCFDGKNPYPKDTLLAEYGTPRIGYDVWRWK